MSRALATLRGIGRWMRLHERSIVGAGPSAFTPPADPAQVAQNTQQGGQAPGTRTLELPVQRPDVAVPVIELFLDPAT